MVYLPTKDSQLLEKIVEFLTGRDYVSSFAADSAHPLMSAVTLCDTILQQGQGMHGSFSRADTFNCMAAFGPDFKQHFLDLAPVSNVDLAKTLARVLQLELPLRGRLEGRVLSEALEGGPDNIVRESGSPADQAGGRNDEDAGSRDRPPTFPP